VTTGILLLHGSSGKPDLGRVKILEAEGFDVVAPQWFDDRISEIPLESSGWRAAARTKRTARSAPRPGHTWCRS